MGASGGRVFTHIERALKRVQVPAFTGMAADCWVNT